MNPESSDADATKDDALPPAALATQGDATAAAATTPDVANDKPDGLHILADMKKLFVETKIRGTPGSPGNDGKSVWAVTIETFGMAEGGKWIKSDRVAETEAEALNILKEMVKAAKDKCKTPEQVKKWDLPYSPLKEFDATVDDVLLSFCKWAKLDINEAKRPARKQSTASTESTSETSKTAEITADNEGTATSGSAIIRKTADDDDDNDAVAASHLKNVMNISKAFRRLETYVNWMHDNRSKLLMEDAWTTESLTPAAQAFGMKLTHDKSGRLVWWFDVKTMDISALHAKEVSIAESIRFMVWATHLVLLDKQAQDNGMCFVEDLDQIGFWRFMSAFPLEVGAQMDRLTIGVLPIKMKAIYVMKAAMWMNVLLGMMKAFMSKKMRQRIVIIKKDQDAQAVLNEALGGPEYIPINCCGLQGTMEKDIFFGRYFKEKPLASTEQVSSSD